MSEELLQRDLINNPEKIGTWNFYNIGSTTIENLKNAGIIRNIDYGSIKNKKIDALITRQKEVIAVIEYKSPNRFNSRVKKEKAIRQEIEVAEKLNTKLIIATDTTETIWVNVATGNEIKDENENIFNLQFNPKDEGLQNVIAKIIQSITKHNDKILPIKSIDPSDLARSIWQDIWSVSGATPENCLYTFVELFIFKYLSDLNILTGTHSFKHLLLMYKQGNDDNTVLQHYASIVRKHIKNLFPENPIDKTTIINGTIFVSKDQTAVDGYSAVFKKVLEKFRDYGKLENIDYDFKSKLFESFLKESISKSNWGQFFTPIKVIRAINEMAKGELKEDMSICDPACGVGKFPLEFIKDNISEFFKLSDGKIIKKIKIIGFDKGFDKEEQKTIILAKANMLIYFCDFIKENPRHTKEFAKLFNESFILKTNSILGTLSDPVRDQFDLILTNPPYVVSGSSNLKEEISKSTELKNYYQINATGSEGLFLEWIIRALKPKGKAFVVIPIGILHSTNHKKLRNFIIEQCFIEAIISLPNKTFFMTPKKTYIIIITKKNNISLIQTEPIFTYICSEIGESRDVNRFSIEKDDLTEASNLFNAFKGNKEYFASINSDKRCKVIKFQDFIANASWVIENCWTDNEHIEIGTKKQKEKINLIDCSNSLEEIANSIKLLYEDAKNIFADGQNFKYVELLDKNYFQLRRGRRITKQTINQNQGNIPVYSSSKYNNSVLGLISENYLRLNNLVLFDKPSILINIDGSVGHCFIREDNKYSFIDVVAGLTPKKEGIELEYLLYVLREELIKTGANYETKLYFSKMKNYDIKIPIPIKENGNFDIEKQSQLGNIYEEISKLKLEANRELIKLENATIN